MITDGEKWHQFALKNERTFDGEKWHSRAVASLSRLLRGITSNHNGDFYRLNCCHSYSAEDVMNMITVMQKCLRKTIKY